ncbi:phenylalanine--tRNA ligase subunit beta [Candidatus Woesearchaeota archaeon]|nr:phenylalanine--tRNA ligase subunit beta [Candidatus Woesearchaeota archaeon]
MPTITFSLKDLHSLIGKSISAKEVERLAEYAKGDVEEINNDEIKINFEDTNLPYLWSIEGFARLLKGVLGKEKGIPNFEAEKNNETIIVDKNLKNVRPFVAAFAAKGQKINAPLLKQIIQLQEKICESYGRKREKVAIGVYSHKKITFPVHYKATDPNSVQFVPLDYKIDMTQAEILDAHPKGVEYGWILKNAKKYPLLIDDNGQVLSFPPIINSNFSGKVEAGDSDFLVEATGTDWDAVHLALNIFAQAFFDRGFKIYALKIKYEDKTVYTPFDFNETIKLSPTDVEHILGLKLSENQIKAFLEKARFGYKKGVAQVPFYRKDALHKVDVIEDIGIMYGYNNFGETELKSYTAGEPKPIVKLANLSRDSMIGLGYQEVMSAMLSNKSVLYEKMCIKDFGTIEIESCMSETHSAVRTWITPQLLDVLSKNKHIEYPQKIFEQGLITKKDLEDCERLASATAHPKATFTEIKQALDFMMRNLGYSYLIENGKHESFIEGRVGRIIVNNQKVGYIGEIHPQVLANFGLEVPVAAFEINLTDLFKI